MHSLCARFILLEIASRPKRDGELRAEHEPGVVPAGGGTVGKPVVTTTSTTTSISSTSICTAPLHTDHPLSLVRTESGILERNGAGVIVQHSPERIIELEVEMLREVEAAAAMESGSSTSSSSVAVSANGAAADGDSPTDDRRLVIDESHPAKASDHGEGGCSVEARKTQPTKSHRKRRSSTEVSQAVAAKAARLGIVPAGYMWSNNKPPMLISIPARVRGGKGSGRAGLRCPGLLSSGAPLVDDGAGGAEGASSISSN